MTQKSLLSPWSRLYKTFARCSALVATAEENVCCEELCGKMAAILDTKVLSVSRLKARNMFFGRYKSSSTCHCTRRIILFKLFLVRLLFVTAKNCRPFSTFCRANALHYILYTVPCDDCFFNVGHMNMKFRLPAYGSALFVSSVGLFVSLSFNSESINLGSHGQPSPHHY